MQRFTIDLYKPDKNIFLFCLYFPFCFILLIVAYIYREKHLENLFSMIVSGGILFFMFYAGAALLLRVKRGAGSRIILYDKSIVMPNPIGNFFPFFVKEKEFQFQSIESIVIDDTKIGRRLLLKFKDGRSRDIVSKRISESDRNNIITTFEEYKP